MKTFTYRGETVRYSEREYRAGLYLPFVEPHGASGSSGYWACPNCADKGTPSRLQDYDATGQKFGCAACGFTCKPHTPEELEEIHDKRKRLGDLTEKLNLKNRKIRPGEKF